MNKVLGNWICLFMVSQAGIAYGAPASITLKVSTLNSYAARFISPYQEERLPKIGEIIKEKHIDVAFIQEAWTGWSRKTISDASELPFGEYVAGSGLVGSGLFTLSRYPVLSTDFKEFSLSGLITKPWFLDIFIGKGVSQVTIDVNGTVVDVFNVHLMPRILDSLDPFDEFTPLRMSQLFEIFDFILEHRKSNYFIVAGDFNSHQDSEELKFFQNLFGLEMTRLSMPDNCTYCPPNTFLTGYRDSGQLDYIGVSPYLTLKGFRRDFEGTVKTSKGYETSLSDHFGITAEVGFLDGPNRAATANTLEALRFFKGKLDNYMGWGNILSQVDSESFWDKFKFRKNFDRIYGRVTMLIGALENQISEGSKENWLSSSLNKSQLN